MLDTPSCFYTQNQFPSEPEASLVMTIGDDSAG